jgi:hypothetical protein
LETPIARTRPSARSVVDGTRGVRELTAPVWVFDPQKIAQEEAQWWWNPLSYVTDEEKAYKLTQHFSVGSRVPGSKPDAYFDSKAEDILSSYFLAAALGGLPITRVYLWVTEQVNREPINILKEHDYELPYKGLESTLELADKQRDGIFGTAEKMIQCLKSGNTLRWVAPMGGATVATNPAGSSTLTCSPPHRRRSTSSPRKVPAPLPPSPQH